MKQINQIAGDILLFFYGLQAKNGFIDKKGISFGSGPSGLRVIDETELVDPILKLAEQNVPAAYNAMRYLAEEGLIKYDKGLGSMKRMVYYGLSVTSRGIKLIEDVEKGVNEKRQFNLIFNIKLADKITVDSLLKAELGSVFKLI